MTDDSCRPEQGCPSLGFCLTCGRICVMHTWAETCQRCRAGILSKFHLNSENAEQLAWAESPLWNKHTNIGCLIWGWCFDSTLNCNKGKYLFGYFLFHVVAAFIGISPILSTAPRIVRPFVCWLHFIKFSINYKESLHLFGFCIWAIRPSSIGHPWHRRALVFMYNICSAKGIFWQFKYFAYFCSNSVLFTVVQ